MPRSTWMAELSVLRTWPGPPQCGQVTKLVSASDGRSRWRHISSRPKWLMLADLDAGAVVLQRVLQPALDRRGCCGFLHVDEVDDDQAGEVAQAQLAGDFVGGLQVGLAARSPRCCARGWSGRS